MIKKKRIIIDPSGMGKKSWKSRSKKYTILRNKKGYFIKYIVK